MKTTSTNKKPKKALTGTQIIAKWGHYPCTHPDLISVILVPLAHKLIRKHQSVCGDGTIPESLIFGATHHLLQRRYLITNLITSVLIGLLIGILGNCLTGDSTVHSDVVSIIVCVCVVASLIFQNWRPWCKPQPLSTMPKDYPLKGFEFITRQKLFFEFAECCQLVDILFFDWIENVLASKSVAGQAILNSNSNFNYFEHELWAYFQERVLQRCKEIATIIKKNPADEEANTEFRARLKFLIAKSVQYNLIKLGSPGTPSSIDIIYRDAYRNEV